MNDLRLPVAALLAASLLALPADEPAPAPAPATIDFEALTPGAVPDEFMATDQEAKFAIVADGTGKVLELAGQPIVDGGMLLGKSVKGPGTVKARIKATGKRRTQPRFGVGFHGVSGPRLRVVPATKQVEIILTTDQETAIATADYAWTSGTWTWLEFTVTPGEGGGSLLEGRIWQDGQPRPDKPTVSAKTEDAPAQGKASVWGTPYSEFPVWFDDVTITAAAAPAK